MKVDRIVGLFTAQDIPAQNSRTKKAEESVSNSEAVKVSPELSRTSASSADAERAEKVARLKKEVAAGTYKPDLQKVAAAVVQELFA